VARSTTESRSVVTFAGPPDAVEGIVPVPPERRRDVVVTIATDDGWEQVRALTAPMGRSTLVRLVLPPDVTPGEADARVDVGEESFPAVVTTSARVDLQAVPDRIDVDLEGEAATATLAITNLGNTPVDIPDIAAFGLMADGGLETAIGVGLTGKETGLDRVARTADALADLHGGLVRVSLKSAPAHLEPGDTATVVASLKPSGSPAPTHGYHGVLPLLTLRIPVTVTVPSRKTPTTTRRRTTKKEAPS
jgi:hypothetical protein